MNGFLSVLCLMLAGQDAQLSGRVVDVQGQPIGGAIVVISTAGPRVGPATTCPSCYEECKLRSITDSDGRFEFTELSSNLLFSLAAGASGYQGVVSKRFDPAAGPKIDLVLEKLASVTAGGNVRAIGRVVDLDGNPIAGAQVSPRMVQRAGGLIGGPANLVTPLTVTDAEGNFEVACGDEVRSFDLRASAAGYAPADEPWRRLGVGNGAVTIRLGPGASVRGRLMLGDRPLGGVELGIVQKERVIGNIVTPAQVHTDADGFFRFDQLPPDRDYTLYTHTDQSAAGALPVSLVGLAGHGMQVDLGELPTQKPHRLTIMVRTDDGSPLPAESTIYLGRRDAWRGSSFTLAQQSWVQIDVDDVATESFQIGVRVPGYEVSETEPAMNEDLNRRYGVSIAGPTRVTIVVRKIGQAAAKPGQDAMSASLGEAT